MVSEHSILRPSMTVQTKVDTSSSISDLKKFILERLRTPSWFSELSAMPEEVRGRTILVVVHYPAHEVNNPVIYRALSGIELIEDVRYLPAESGFHSRVQFRKKFDADWAHRYYNGMYLPEACCKLEIHWCNDVISWNAQWINDIKIAYEADDTHVVKIDDGLLGKELKNDMMINREEEQPEIQMRGELNVEKEISPLGARQVFTKMTNSQICHEHELSVDISKELGTIDQVGLNLKVSAVMTALEQHNSKVDKFDEHIKGDLLASSDDDQDSSNVLVIDELNDTVPCFDPGGGFKISVLAEVGEIIGESHSLEISNKTERCCYCINLARKANWIAHTSLDHIDVGIPNMCAHWTALLALYAGENGLILAEFSVFKPKLLIAANESVEMVFGFRGNRLEYDATAVAPNHESSRYLPGVSPFGITIVNQSDHLTLKWGQAISIFQKWFLETHLCGSLTCLKTFSFDPGKEQLLVTGMPNLSRTDLLEMGLNQHGFLTLGIYQAYGNPMFQKLILGIHEVIASDDVRLLQFDEFTRISHFPMCSVNAFEPLFELNNSPEAFVFDSIGEELVLDICKFGHSLISFFLCGHIVVIETVTPAETYEHGTDICSIETSLLRLKVLSDWLNIIIGCIKMLPFDPGGSLFVMNLSGFHNETSETQTQLSTEAKKSMAQPLKLREHRSAFLQHLISKGILRGSKHNPKIQPRSKEEETSLFTMYIFKMYKKYAYGWKFEVVKTVEFEELYKSAIACIGIFTFDLGRLKFSELFLGFMLGKLWRMKIEVSFIASADFVWKIIRLRYFNHVFAQHLAKLNLHLTTERSCTLFVLRLLKMIWVGHGLKINPTDPAGKGLVLSIHAMYLPNGDEVVLVNECLSQVAATLGIANTYAQLAILINTKAWEENLIRRSLSLNAQLVVHFHVYSSFDKELNGEGSSNQGPLGDVRALMKSVTAYCQELVLDPWEKWPIQRGKLTICITWMLLLLVVKTTSSSLEALFRLVKTDNVRLVFDPGGECPRLTSKVQPHCDLSLSFCVALSKEHCSLILEDKDPLKKGVLLQEFKLNSLFSVIYLLRAKSGSFNYFIQPGLFRFRVSCCT